VFDDPTAAETEPMRLRMTNGLFVGGKTVSTEPSSA
jgi:hypothetical protein